MGQVPGKGNLYLFLDFGPKFEFCAMSENLPLSAFDPLSK